MKQTAHRRVTVAAPAKINLFLHVGVRGADGFHALASLVAFADVEDRLVVATGETGLVLDVTGPFADEAGAVGDNLVLRAARAFGVNDLRIQLEKNIPVAAGLGGGSADAAAMLRALAALFPDAASPEHLMGIAASLGADVPMCLASTPVFATGRGEVLVPAPPLPELAIVLVNPRVKVPTVEIFRRLNQRRGAVIPPPPASFPDAQSLGAYLSACGNDLEAPARLVAPMITDVRQALALHDTAIASGMSGSGATCYALFNTRDAAKACAAGIAREHPAWWARAAMLASAPNQPVTEEIQ